MRKATVFIEEHLCKEIEIEVPDYIDDAMEWVKDKAKEMYFNEEIVLTADDFNGQRCMMVQDDEGHETNWFNF